MLERIYLKIQPIFIIALLAGLVCSPLNALAADDGTELDLTTCIQMALDYSPNLDQALEVMAQSRYAKKEAQTDYLPTFSTSYGWQKNQEASYTSLEEAYVWTTTMRQPVFTGFSTVATNRIAELGIEISDVNYQLAAITVAATVKVAYFDYLAAQKAVLVADDSIKLLESQLKTAKDFHEVGLLPINDVLRSEVELSNARQEKITADNSREVTRAALNRLLGRPVSAPLDIKDLLIHQPLDLEYETARNIAMVDRPEIKALNLRIQQSEHAVTRAESEYYPQLNFMASYAFQGDEPGLGGSESLDASNWTVGAEISWNFFEWGRTGYRTNQARAEVRRNEYALRDLMDSVDLEVKQAYLFMQESDKAIVNARVAITQAEENYRITNERYKEQLTTNTELLDAQVLLTRARNHMVTSLTVYNRAVARLYQAMGRGLPETWQPRQPTLESAFFIPGQ